MVQPELGSWCHSTTMMLQFPGQSESSMPESLRAPLWDHALSVFTLQHRINPPWTQTLITATRSQWLRAEESSWNHWWKTTQFLFREMRRTHEARRAVSLLLLTLRDETATLCSLVRPEAHDRTWRPSLILWLVTGERGATHSPAHPGQNV